jgi:ATP-dependent Clp protease adaptor protein ClpS
LVHLPSVTGPIQNPCSNSTATPTLPARPRTAPSQPQLQPDLEPPYHVILHNDDTHTYAYVIEMMMILFGYDEKRGYKIACEVDESGRVIVVTCHKELAELRVEQIHEFGADPRMKESRGSMKATMEPAE